MFFKPIEYMLEKTTENEKKIYALPQKISETYKIIHFLNFVLNLYDTICNLTCYNSGVKKKNLEFLIH